VAWSKPSDQLVARFERSLPDASGVERRQMFGMPCAFANGNMFVGLFEERLMVRLDEPARGELSAAGGEQFAPMGRPMREYVVVPAGVVADETALAGWVDRAFRFASSLPAKAPKPKKAKRA
jgi:TfoX/Sxy family transcriptional regulator of competence genes